MGIKNLDGKISGKISNKTPTIKGNLVNRVPTISGGLTTMPTGIDYDKAIINKPIEQDTTEAWNSQPNLIAKKGHLYFYTDYKNVGGENIAGLKLGDGTSYLIDLPFVDAQFQEHISDTIVHITQQEREFWNNKNRAVITGENLILTDL